MITACIAAPPVLTGSIVGSPATETEREESDDCWELAGESALSVALPSEVPGVPACGLGWVASSRLRRMRKEGLLPPSAEESTSAMAALAREKALLVPAAAGSAATDTGSDSPGDGEDGGRWSMMRRAARTKGWNASIIWLLLTAVLARSSSWAISSITWYYVRVTHG